MESRKLKRYDSAPISTGVSSSSAAAAAARAAEHVANNPRPQGAGVTAAKPTINAAAAATGTPATPSSTGVNPADSYEKQLEAYYRCMEEDNQALATYYEKHTMDIASLKVLAQERRYKETVMRAMEAKVAAMDAFLIEMMDVAAPSRGLKARGDTNARETAKGGKTGAANTTATAPPSMESVREAVLRLQSTLLTVTASEEKHRAALEALEREVAEWKEKALARVARTKSGGGGVDAGAVDDDTVYLPGTAKELRDAQRKVRELERRLTKAASESRDAAAAVRQLERQQRATTDTLSRREDELAAMRALLDVKEQLLSAHEDEAKIARSTGASSVGPRAGSGRYVRTNSAPTGAASRQQQGHFFGGEKSSDCLVVTHHYRLLGGQRFVDGEVFSPESFKDALLRSISTLLHVPYGYLTNVELRTHAEAVSIELDIRHSSRVKEDEIDFRLLSHDYPEVIAYLDKAATELAAQKPQDRTALRVRELQETIVEREREVAHLRRKLRGLEESLERRDKDREVMDKDVDAALQETEGTVQELYQALQAAQQEVEAAKKALASKSLQARVAEQAKDAVVGAAATAERALQDELANVKALLAAARAEAEAAQESVAQATAQAIAAATGELCVDVFTFDVPLPTSSAQRVAAALLPDAQHARMLHALLLAHAGQTGGAVPVQVKSCALSDASNAPTTTTSEKSRSRGGAAAATALQVTVELACYATQQNAGTVKAAVQAKLQEGGSCTAVLEYLRLRDEATRREATAAADAQRAVVKAEQRAAVAIAAMRSETQRLQETKVSAAVQQLQGVAARIACVLPLASDSETLVARVDALVARLTSAETAAQRSEEAAQRAERRLSEAQQEREQLQQTLSALTERCAEVRVAKEQVEARLAALDGKLAAAEEAEGTLAERVRRLESALRAKTSSADSEKERLTSELQAAQVLVASQRTELKAMEKEMQLAKQSASAAVAATATTAAVAPKAAKSAVNEEAALREALRIAKEDRTALVRQLREMETDMNDLSNIQAAMQEELESAQQELRAKKHDFDLLVKQLIRMEEKEKKWQADQRLRHEQQKEQQPQLDSPDSSARPNNNEDAEKDDVARESLVVLTNSNTNLQQCLRRMQRTMSAMGMHVRVTAARPQDSNGAVEEVQGSGRTRRSGHRRGALSATVSRAAMDHQHLSAQLVELLFPVLEELERTTGHHDKDGGPSAGAAYARTASYSSAGGGVQTRTVKQHPSGSPFARTRSTPVVVMGYASQHAAEAAAAGTSSQRNTPKAQQRSASDAAFASPTGMMGSPGKATVDAAPRLDFHRQGSSRSFVQSNTITNAAAAAAAQTNGSGGGGLPPPASSGSSEGEKERRSRELPQRRTGSGAAAGSGGSYANAPRRYNASVSASTTTTGTMTAKSNPFRRSNTATAGAPSPAGVPSPATAASGSGGSGPASAMNYARVGSGYRRTPINTAEIGAALGTSQTHKPYRRRF